jgi:6-phosphogluconolactonase
VLYAITEMGSTVIAFAYDAEKGTLNEFQTVSTLPHGFTGASTTAEIVVNPEGTVLYGSNRGADSLALFAINPDNFTLATPEFAPTLGKTPRHFTLDPTGRFLMVENQDSNNVVVFHVHERTGQLTPTRLPVEVSMPVCLVFVPVG